LQLLVSVRSALEVKAALSGGADIVDAKEPARGSLGAVSAETLSEIMSCVPPTKAFSVALGDVSTVDEVEATLASVHLSKRTAPTFLKLGFAGGRSAERVRPLLNAAVQTAAHAHLSPGIVAVAYADNERANSISPNLLLTLANQAGVAGVLLDTYVKDGRGLLDWWKRTPLKAWVSEARTHGLMTALAGALSLADVDAIRAIGPDVIGFRGAACDGGRSGRVSVERVRLLRREVEVGRSRVAVSAYAAKPGGETPDDGPYPTSATVPK
jgi:uncharacterized protein (UPF0264 family)